VVRALLVFYGEEVEMMLEPTAHGETQDDLHGRRSVNELRRCIAHLAAAVATVDGRITPAELVALERLNELGLGPLAALAAEEMEQIADAPVDLLGSCTRLAALVPDAAPVVVTALAEIAAADGEIERAEIDLLRWIAAALGLTAEEATRLLETVTMAHSVGLTASPPSIPRPPDERVDVAPAPSDTVARARTVLGVGPEADGAEIDRAYRALVERYDPGKVIDLGPDFARLAVRKLALVTDAYDIAAGAIGARSGLRGSSRIA
jgi:DnaJ-domain-containing protein 1